MGFVATTHVTINETIYFLGNTITPPKITGAKISFTLNDVVEANGAIIEAM